jgi:hypothetical protein
LRAVPNDSKATLREARRRITHRRNRHTGEVNTSRDRDTLTHTSYRHWSASVEGENGCHINVSTRSATRRENGVEIGDSADRVSGIIINIEVTTIGSLSYGGR